MTHDTLVQLTVAWAEHLGHCPVITEIGRGRFGERADVFSLDKDAASYMFECKISKADLRRDAGKPWRKRGIGRIRWYVLSQEIGKVTVPPNWGILRATDKGDGLDMEREASILTNTSWDLHSEVCLLSRVIRELTLDPSGGKTATGKRGAVGRAGDAKKDAWLSDCVTYAAQFPSGTLMVKDVVMGVGPGPFPDRKAARLWLDKRWAEQGCLTNTSPRRVITKQE